MATLPQYGHPQFDSKPHPILADQVRALVNRIRSGNEPAATTAVRLWTSPTGSLAFSFPGDRELVRLDARSRLDCPRKGTYLEILYEEVKRRLEPLWQLLEAAATKLEAVVDTARAVLVLRLKTQFVEIPIIVPTET